MEGLRLDKIVIKPAIRYNGQDKGGALGARRIARYASSCSVVRMALTIMGA